MLFLTIRWCYILHTGSLMADTNHFFYEWLLNLNQMLQETKMCKHIPNMSTGDLLWWHRLKPVLLLATLWTHFGTTGRRLASRHCKFTSSDWGNKPLPTVWNVEPNVGLSFNQANKWLYVCLRLERRLHFWWITAAARSDGSHQEDVLSPALIRTKRWFIACTYHNVIIRESFWRVWL